MRTFLAALALVLLPTFATAASCNLPRNQGAQVQALLEGVNAQRRAAGLPDLTWHPKLAAAAQAQACEMAKTKDFAHSGQTLRKNASQMGCGRTSEAAENIAWGYKDAGAVLKGWRASSQHHRNYMLPRSILTGAAFAIADDGTPYWSMIYAARCK